MTTPTLLRAEIPSAPRAEPPDHAHKFLSIALHAQDYGVDIRCVQEVRSFEPVTRLPAAPSALLGVLNLRGNIVPVCDLRVLTGAPAQFDERTVTVVLNLGACTVGVVADAVSDVVSVPAASLRPAPAMDSGPGVQGLATLRDGDRESLLIVLDPAALLREVLGGTDLVHAPAPMHSVH